MSADGTGNADRVRPGTLSPPLGSYIRASRFLREHIFLCITSALSLLLVASLVLNLQRYLPSPLVAIWKVLLLPYALTIMAFKGSAYDVSPGYNASETMVFVLALLVTVYVHTLVGRLADRYRSRAGRLTPRGDMNT